MGSVLRPMQTDATLLANNTQHCWAKHACCVRLHGTTTMFALVAYSLKPVKLLGTYKRTQHGWPTTHNVVTCCVRLHELWQNLLPLIAWTTNNFWAWGKNREIIFLKKLEIFEKLWFLWLTVRPWDFGENRESHGKTARLERPAKLLIILKCSWLDSRNPWGN